MRSSVLFSATAMLACGVLSAYPVLALDTGSEPIYQILPAIAITGAAIPPEAPGFAIVDRGTDSETVQRGRLFRITGDPRIYGRLAGEAVSVPLDGQTTVVYARSPGDQFLAQVVTHSGGTGDLVRVMALTGDTAPLVMDATAAADLLTPGTCGAEAGAWDGEGATAPKLLAAAWKDETDLRLFWQLQGSANFVPQTVDAVIQMAGVAKPALVACTVTTAEAAADAATVKPLSSYRRDMIGRARVLTFYRLAVMQEAAAGTRPMALNTTPGLAYSSLSTGDLGVQQALTEMQPLVQVVSPVPPAPVVTRDRPRATGFLRPVENGIPRPNFTRAGFGLIAGEGSRRYLNRGAEGGMGGLGKVDN